MNKTIGAMGHQQAKRVAIHILYIWLCEFIIISFGCIEQTIVIINFVRGIPVLESKLDNELIWLSNIRGTISYIWKTVYHLFNSSFCLSY